MTARRISGRGWLAWMAGLCRVGLCMTGLCMAAGLAAGLAGPATAQGIDPPTPAPSATGIATGPGGGKWRGQITPYVWATGLGGSIRPAGTDRGVRIDTSFTDLLRDLDGALFVSGLARRDRLVLLGDLSWSSSSRAGVLPVPPAGLPARARLRQTSATLAGGWRAIEGPGTTVDLLAGARLWRVRGAVSSALGAAASTHSFVDPLVAARVNLRIAPQWSALVHVDVGGFGAGSHRATQVLGTVNHRTDSGITVSAGYRHLEVDYRRGGSRFDLRMGGPILGATWQF